MKNLRRQARVTAFLRNSLAEGAQDVLTLEAMARTEGFLDDRQRITHTKPFKRAKHSLRIRSVRAGFGPNGVWRWELPCDRDGASTAAAMTREPVREERCVPVGWVEGVARLGCLRSLAHLPQGDGRTRPVLAGGEEGGELLRGERRIIRQKNQAT